MAVYLGNIFLRLSQQNEFQERYHSLYTKYNLTYLSLSLIIFNLRSYH